MTQCHEQQKQERLVLPMFYKVDDRFYRSSLPSTAEELDFIKSKQVSTIISLEPLSEVARKMAEERLIKVINFPLPDGQVPDREQIERFLNLVDQELSLGSSILIHCMAGRDRTGLMTGFYLIRFHGLDPLQAYWEADKKFLGDNPEFKKHLLTEGEEVKKKNSL